MPKQPRREGEIMADIRMEQLLALVGRAILEAQQSLRAHELASYWRYFNAITPEGEATPAVLAGQEDGAALPRPEAAIPADDLPLTPKLRRIRLPRPEGGGAQNELYAPVLSLVHHNALTLDEVRVRMKLAAVADEKTGALHVRVGPAGPSSPDASLQDKAQTAPASGEHEIELVFRQNAPAEGIARITQEITQLL
jgi:hypothetical protein